MVKGAPVTRSAREPVHLGYTATELATSPYARFFKPEMSALPAHVREAIAVGLQTVDLLPPVASAPELQTPGYWPVENGVTISPDGAFRVFVRTDMPGVTPAMWDWWFAWHGSEAQRYKLWHPRAMLVLASLPGGRFLLQTSNGREARPILHSCRTPRRVMRALRVLQL